MANCPNCGRHAMRTKDWVCQWCGYPLLGGGFKPIDKTYKELQEERNSSWKSVKPEPEPEFDFNNGSEPEPPEIEPPPRQPEVPPPDYRPQPEPEPVHEPEPYIPPPPVAPSSPPPPPATAPVYEPVPELAPQPQPEQLPPGPPEPEQLPEAEEMAQLEPELVAKPEPPPVAPPSPEPAPPPPVQTPAPSLSSITEGSQLTIDQIDELFRADIAGAHAALKDKTIVVKGIVNKVFIRDHLEIRYLTLNGASRVAWSARCTFGKQASSDMSRLSEGQAVALRGKYDGYSKNIIFKDCTLLASN